jgi:hypothetical protein
MAVGEHEAVGSENKARAGAALTVVLLAHLDVHNRRTDAGDSAHYSTRIGVKQAGIGILR